MEIASRIRWILMIVIVVIMLFLVGWGMYSIARNIFSPDTSGTSSSEVASESENPVLTSGSARWYVDGPVVAVKDHRSYEIVISSGVVEVKFFAEYGAKVLGSKSYSNSQRSYDTFLKALDYSNASARQRGTTAEDDNSERGVCPEAKRYILEMDSFRRWSTDCGRDSGTAGYSTREIESLFIAQVPDYDELKAELDFSL